MSGARRGQIIQRRSRPKPGGRRPRRGPDRETTRGANLPATMPTCTQIHKGRIEPSCNRQVRGEAGGGERERGTAGREKEDAEVAVIGGVVGEVAVVAVVVVDIAVVVLVFVFMSVLSC